MRLWKLLNRWLAHLKSPGPDEFNPSFYQSYWYIIGEEVTSIALNFLNDSLFDSCINFTYIVLIPKVKNLVNDFDFRLISLCDLIYKLVSKFLASHLKKIISFIISQIQSAFLFGWIITDNIIIAYEVLHSMKTKQKCQEGSMSIKLDISKAYDKLEWNFLEAMMRKLGFREV